MSAQKFKKGLISFLFLSMLFVLGSCSSSSSPSGPSEQQGVKSSAGASQSSNSSAVIPSSSSHHSSSSEDVISSSSEIESSSDSGNTASSSSEVANLSSSSEVTGTSSSAVATSSSSNSVASSSSRATSSNSVVSSSSRATSSSSVVTGGASSSSVAATVSSSSQASSPVTTRSWTNVDYASTAPAANKHDRQRLDLKLPDSGNGPFPLILYVHGGGFTGGNWQLSSNNNGLISAARSKGYAVASAGYLLYGNNPSKPSFPYMVEDILAAIRHLRANAETYHLDPNKFVISGYSAGGYLSNIVCALSGTTHTYDITTLGNAGVSSNVQAAASSAGLTDFSKLVAQSGSTMHNTMAGGPLGGNLTDNTESMKNNLQKQNPLNWVSTNTPPIYLRHGTSDNIVPYQQSDIFVDKIKSVSPNAETAGKLKYNKRSGGGHDDFDNSDATAILDFLDKALGIQR